MRRTLLIFALILIVTGAQACKTKEEAGAGETMKRDSTASASNVNAQGADPSFRNAGLPGGGKVFKGTIDYKYKIQMTLRRDGNDLTGSYFYTNKRTEIALKGSVDSGGNLTLKETDANGAQTGTFKGKWTEKPEGVELEGTWTKPNSKDELSFYLTEQHVEFTADWKITTKQIKEENKQRRFTIDVEYPQIEGSDNENVKQFNQQISSLVIKAVNEWKQGAGAQAGEEDTMPEAEDDAYDSGYNIEFANDDIVSVIIDTSIYEHGAAHPNSASETFNYDLKSGKPIKLSDVFKPGAQYIKKLSEYCIADLKKQARQDNPEEPMLNDDEIETGAAPEAENYSRWNITKKGLLITFDAYQVGPYAAGPQMVLVPYSALKDTINPNGPAAPFLK